MGTRRYSSSPSNCRSILKELASLMHDESVLPFGAYETPVTTRIKQRLKATERSLPTTAFATAPGGDDRFKSRYLHALSQIIGTRLEAKLRRLSPEDRMELINSVAELIDPEDAIDTEELLYAVHKSQLEDPPALPEIPLTGAALLTNAGKDQNMSSELRREFQTTDSVDLICAFIKSSGIRVMHDELMDLKNRGVPVRVITSTYCGATEAAAIDRLVNVYGAEVKISYESKTTKLHAKAWLLRRKSGFDTAYIGSSNLSNSALIDGVEWNVRTSVSTTPTIVEKFIATFDTYWNDVHYVSYNPLKDKETLDTALIRAGGSDPDSLRLSGLDVRPYPYQEAMLEALQAERVEHHRHRNLIVAATGTGKTVVAALDYRNLVTQWNKRPKLLFVAHRIEILKQARKTFREVLKDPSFGEILGGGKSPSKWEYVFAMVQSLSSERLEKLAADHFDVVIIDEFHHAEAPTYRRTMDHFNPRELLGLTATPERADGENMQKFFDYRVAYELRLWDALNHQLLAPMHYFGINDETDLSNVAWSSNAKDYDSTALSEFYIKAGERRINLILNEINKRIFNLAEMKALGFCVNVAHAQYMAHRFSERGISSVAISHETSNEDRHDAIQKLANGDIKVLFAVDIFNEGIDIPSVNTLLLLRPTQSPTVFLQQLGRGLRLHPGKDVCTVMDFIGQQRTEYSFEARYFALTGKRGPALKEAIEEEFPHMPPGTNIILDEVSQEQVLQNVKRASSISAKALRGRITDVATTGLSIFLEETGLDIDDVYRRKDLNWTSLLRSVHLSKVEMPSAEEKHLLNRLRSLLHINDSERARAYIELLSQDGPTESDMDPTMRAYSRMLIAVFWAQQHQRPVPPTIDEALEVLRSYPSLAAELEEIISVTLSNSRRLPSRLPGSFGFGALFSHADYSMAELVGALRDEPLPEVLKLPREGVYFNEELDLDLFFVTLVKDAKNYSPTTSYKDYPISPERFHWESQATTSLASKTAHRYIHHSELGSTVMMAVRNTRVNEVGLANAYTLLGEIDYVRHQSEKPIQVEWSLRRPMPNKLYTEGRAVV